MTIQSDLLLDINRKHHIIVEEGETTYFDQKKMFDVLPQTIMDKRTLRMAEVDELFKVVNHTITSVGAAKLFHSLMHPTDSLELIRAKQEALRELEANEALCDSIRVYLETFKRGEKAMFKHLNANMLPIFPYRDFSLAMNAGASMLKGLEEIPRPRSAYLDSLIKSILCFGTSSACAMMEGVIFRTLAGLKPRRKKRFFEPSLRFRCGRLSGGTIWPALPSLLSLAAGYAGYIPVITGQSLFLLTCWGALLGLFYGVAVKPIFDYETVMLPMRQRLLESSRFISAIEAIGDLDEILSLFAYKKSIPHPTVLPDVSKSPIHYFVAREMRNPVRAVTDKDFVPNDCHLDGARVSFITGPNSGGKTTFCKTVVQNQILGQIGGPVVAREAWISIADCIAYQAPMFDSLLDDEGRFGTELKMTRDIFFSVTPRSLAVLDEIAEGTTTREKMSFSVDIINGFYAKGNNTIMVTHSHELVEKFREQGKGQYLQVEFDGERPTHRLVEGISTQSHAIAVARKIGFAPEDIDRHLREEGYV